MLCAVIIYFLILIKIHAGLSALVILLSHGEHMNDIIQEHEGILKGYSEASAYVF